jgi:two-component system sensor histidine kinase GlrK
LEAGLEKLRAEILLTHLAALAEIGREAEAARRTGRQAEAISWYAAALALLLCTVISLLIVRSIFTRLRQLTAGTRAVAEGRFVHQLDASGRDEFSQLARDFNTMTQKLGALDTLKKDFVSHVSHELKSPLASIQETIRLLLDQLPGPLTEKQRRLLGLNLRSASRLSAMIANLLDLSRMEAGVLQYDVKYHDLRELIRVAAAENELQAGEKGLKIVLDLPESPLKVECDHDRIIQVMENLLGNAIKFSRNPGTIDVGARLSAGLPPRWRARLGKSARDQTFLMITVADHGPGVLDIQKELIFEKFRQTSQEKRIAGQGVGLGLAIARTIVEAHGGAIGVEDNPGGGSRFIIILPSSAKYRSGPPSSKPI